MLCTKDTLKSHSLPVYQGVCEVHVQCLMHAVNKVQSVNAGEVLVINGNIISLHSFLKRTRSPCCHGVCLLPQMLHNVDNTVGDKSTATSCDGQNMSVLSCEYLIKHRRLV